MPLSPADTPVRPSRQNESRNTEMLAAACAVGVGCCFAAPIGGRWPVQPPALPWALPSHRLRVLAQAQAPGLKWRSPAPCRCLVQHRGHLHLLRGAQLLAGLLCCHLQCLHLPGPGRLES